jgi:hypothetical protein
VETGERSPVASGRMVTARLLGSLEPGGSAVIDTVLAWHVISDQDLVSLLKRAHEGEDPDLLYIELYANGDRDE